MRVIDNHRAALDHLPAGWRSRRMRAAVAKYQSRKNDTDDVTVLSLTRSGVRVKTDLSFGKSTESYVGHQIVGRGQFVFTPRDFDATPILCGVSDHDGCISNLYIVFDVAADIDPKFLEYYFWGLKYGYQYFEKLSFGMRYSFNKKQFEHIPLIHPELPTQKAIAAFLDRETGRIDQLIKKKQRLVELLHERMEAQLEEIVSGRHLKGARVPTGSAFIPDRPVEWSCERLRFSLLRIEQGWSPHAEDRSIADREWGVLKVGCVNWGTFRPEQHKALASGTSRREHIRVREGDLLMSRGNTRELVGSAAIAKDLPGPLMMSDLIYRLVVQPVRAEPAYLAIVLGSRSLRRQIENTVSGSSDTMPKLNQSKIKSLVWARPPLSQQADLLRRFERIKGPVAKVMSSTEASIDRLREYRSALITAAVTGQIDVETWSRRGEGDRRLDRIEQEMAG